MEVPKEVLPQEIIDYIEIEDEFDEEEIIIEEYKKSKRYKATFIAS